MGIMEDMESSLRKLEFRSVIVAGRIIMFQLLVRSNQSDEAKGILFALSMMPLLWGDSFGEIIGSFFGKMTFQVRGLGDVNTKTVEGTVAVFASSFIAQIFMYYYMFELTSASECFVFHPVFFFLPTLASLLQLFKVLRQEVLIISSFRH